MTATLLVQAMQPSPLSKQTDNSKLCTAERVKLSLMLLHT
jgi:hypothetical protein